MELQDDALMEQEVDCIDYSGLTDENPSTETEKDGEMLSIQAIENSVQPNQVNRRTYSSRYFFLMLLFECLLWSSLKILETSEPLLDEQTAISLIQQIVQQGALFNPDPSFVSEDGLQTFIIADGSSDGKKFVIQYIADKTE